MINANWNIYKKFFNAYGIGESNPSFLDEKNMFFFSFYAEHKSYFEKQNWFERSLKTFVVF